MSILMEKAGASAGMAVDTLLFPLDTLKTRLQSPQGFNAAGGFRGIYRGLTSAMLGSAPGASLFFVVYEGWKKQGGNHLMAASLGETAACLVRVPTEVVKQRMQTGQYHSLGEALRTITGSEGLFGFYRGFAMTIFREVRCERVSADSCKIPFACIQFPLYEHFKTIAKASLSPDTQQIPLYLAAMCGSVSGGIAAALTTPLDVIKTRMMLSKAGSEYTTPLKTLQLIVHREGWSKLLSGLGPRVMWISIGGSIFLGVYEAAKRTLLLTQPTL
jgi:solute carrier family 25 S-adenosylmethionine transporter 26